MQVRKAFFNCVAASMLFAGSALFAQNDENFADIHPADVQIERKTDDDQESIFNNQLRGGTSPDEPPANQPPKFNQPQRFQADFDSQPRPPEPSRISGSNAPQARSFDNPLQEMNPNRLMPNFERPPPDRAGPEDQATSPQQPYFERPRPTDNFPRQPALSPPAYQANEILNADPHETAAVATTGYQQSVNSPADFATNDSQNVKSLLAEYEVSNVSQLPGVPVSLEDLLRSTPIQSRMSMIQQYWETYFDWATLRNDTAYGAWLSQLPNPGTGPEQMLLQTARSLAANDKLAAEIQLSRSQSKLQQLSRWYGAELLPLPLNQPLVTKYITHYEWYAQRQRLPSKLKGINEMLPRTYELLANRAATVGQAEQTRDQMKQAFANRQLGIGDLLEAGRTWRSSRNSFVGTAVSYNQAISDYALTITPPQNPVDQIVSMLIAKPESVAEVAQRNSILQRTTQPQQQPPISSRINEFGPVQPSNSLQPPIAQNGGQQQPGYQNQQLQPQPRNGSPGIVQRGTNAFSPARQPDNSSSFGGSGGASPASDNTPASTRQFNSGGGAFDGQ